MYPRVKHQVVIRHTRMGDYLLSRDCVVEIDEPTREILQQCDGLHTVEEIAESVVEGDGELREPVYKELENLLTMLREESVLTYTDTPDPITPIYEYDRPLSIIWEITYACNQRCQYCISNAGKENPHELSEDEIETVLDELIGLQVGLINITGGEPLLRKECVLHIAERASQNGIELELLTNGTLVSVEMAEELYDAGIRFAQVSLDCARPEIHDNQRGVPGAWEKTVRGIENLRKAGINVTAAAVVTSKNIKYYKETQHFLRRIADVVKMGPVVPMGRGENNRCLLTPDMYLELLVLRNTTEENYLSDLVFCKERCSIGTTPVIAPNGDVYPCMLTKYEDLKLGNTREQSIKSIYAESELLRELFEWNVDKISPCKTCWNRYYCGGGCRGCAFAYHGTIYRNDLYQCAARKKFAKELLKRGHPATRSALRQLILLAKK